MVSSAYMLRKPARPGALKRAFDLRVMPLAINAAGGAEAALERASARARIQPLSALLAALACGYLIGGVRRRL